MAKANNIFGSIFTGLFCLIFMSGGIAAFWYSTGQAITGYFYTQSWIQVPAQLNKIKLNGDSTLVKAQYTYRFNGLKYQSKRVSLYTASDNIGSYWRDLYQLLKVQQRNNNNFAWVNPKNPEQALLDRTFRWGMLLFGGVFLLFFCGISGLFLFGLFYKRSKQSDEKNKQKIISQSKNGIPSNAKNSALLFFFFSLPFLLLGLVFIFNFQESINKGEYGIFIVLIFPLAGAFMLIHSIKSYFRYKHIGSTYLFLDPLPANIGGELGAYFNFNHQAKSAVKITLQCIHKNYNNSENNNDRIIWQQDTNAYCKASASGSRCIFIFNIPADVPPSGDTEVARGYIDWQITAITDLYINGKQLIFDRSWHVPVYMSELSTPMQSGLSNYIPSSHIEKVAFEEQASAEKSAQEQIDIHKQHDGYHIISHAGRTNTMAFISTIAGLIFTVAGSIMLYFAFQGTWELWLFGLVFTPIGSLILLVGIDLFGRKRKAIVNSGHIHVTKYWFKWALFTRQDTISASAPDAVYLKETMSSDNGKRKTRYYSIYAKCQNKNLKLAEGIEGKKTAEVLLADIRKFVL